MKRPDYTEEFRREAVRLALSGEKSTGQTARDLGIRVDTLRVWINRLRPRPEGESEPLTPDERQELVRLRRENRRLQEERDILKKAVGIFSGELR